MKVMDFVRARGREITAGGKPLLLRGFDVNTRDPKGQVGLTLALHAGSLSSVLTKLAAYPRRLADLVLDHMR